MKIPVLKQQCFVCCSADYGEGGKAMSTYGSTCSSLCQGCTTNTYWSLSSESGLGAAVTVTVMATVSSCALLIWACTGVLGQLCQQQQLCWPAAYRPAVAQQHCTCNACIEFVPQLADYSLAGKAGVTAVQPNSWVPRCNAAYRQCRIYVGTSKTCHAA